MGDIVYILQFSHVENQKKIFFVRIFRVNCDHFLNQDFKFCTRLSILLYVLWTKVQNLVYNQILFARKYGRPRT